MKTKVIPFDLETSLDIQKGRTKGRIITKLGESVRIVLEAGKGSRFIVALVDNGKKEEARCYTLNGNLLNAGNLSAFDLVLEVPDNEPQFKPFDKVLVRDTNEQRWRCALFSHEEDNGFVASSLPWNQCIPYEGNEDLVGTTNMPKEDKL